MLARFFLLLFLCLLALSARAAEPLPRNIVLIMADDVGIEGLGCYGGSDYRTPHLDELARTGFRFTHAYSQPLCTPTRLQIMSAAARIEVDAFGNPVGP